MKKFFKIMSIIAIVLVVLGVGVYQFVLTYPNLKDNPKTNTWYRVTNSEMKSSDGSKYRAYFKKGKENKVIVYFAGGGVSINEETAKGDFYNKKIVSPDMLGSFTMNMGGIATASENNPFSDWSVIAFPYATGDFHSGTNEYKYIDNNGKEKTLYHYGYKNYTEGMKNVQKYTHIDNPDAVLVTGYSAGGFDAAMLADDIFTNYYPNAVSKTVLVDSSLLILDDWHSVATEVWKTPTSISTNITSDNITLDCLTALHSKYEDKVNILFDSSTRDGDLAEVGNYFATGKLEVDEEQGDIYQQILKREMVKFKEQAGVYLFIWDGLPWYDDPRNLTMHTIIATPTCLTKFEDFNISIVEWAMNAVNGKLEDYGLDLVNKKYN